MRFCDSMMFSSSHPTWSLFYSLSVSLLPNSLMLLALGRVSPQTPIDRGWRRSFDVEFGLGFVTRINTFLSWANGCSWRVVFQGSRTMIRLRFLSDKFQSAAIWNLGDMIAVLLQSVILPSKRTVVSFGCCAQKLRSISSVIFVLIYFLVLVLVLPIIF